MSDEKQGWCRECLKDNHTHHQAPFGGICIGCACTFRPRAVVMELVDELTRAEIVERVNRYDSLIATVKALLPYASTRAEDLAEAYEAEPTGALNRECAELAEKAVSMAEDLLKEIQP